MRLTDVRAAQDSYQLREPPDAMTILALERQKFHEKIVHLRSLREAAEAENVSGTSIGAAASRL